MSSLVESQCGKSCDDNLICGGGGYGGYYLSVYGTELQVSPHLHHLHHLNHLHQVP